MKLRAVAEDTAFRYLMVAGVVAAAGNFVLTYVDTGRLDLVGVVVQVVFVAVIGVALVAYWNYMERRADAE
ncbi:MULTISPECIES: hypothetical protein [Haloferax]|uniref:Uncharacterized protein n=4 Tax=Haloferax TaxID=2251 RepID=A0A6C0UTR1_HALVO|nr:MULTISPECIES: hypothetical protein [Haloferax]ELK45782.1 hypothetical protein D320_21056 [Haloferax sp. BAB-2207]ELZ75114.1 hypothetical protein C456_07632 [Haloferax lucentense DSM 14919]ELZ88423.1 hypothetical protein C452_13209 [Haloferax alexandrinus JCM 10717]NLV03457.1 hypothetical protein [Haloferax alexandrinus]QIB78915.1 hypothetical protein G3A49_12525 [Haloferax alexandrinus]